MKTVIPLIKLSPELPINVELETLAANNESPTTNQFSFFPDKKYPTVSLFFLFERAYIIVEIRNRTIIQVSIIEIPYISCDLKLFGTKVSNCFGLIKRIYNLFEMSGMLKILFQKCIDKLLKCIIF